MSAPPLGLRLQLPTSGLTLAARVHGPEDGLPVLAVHGWLDNAASFDRLAPLLPRARIVAIDLPGHGLSDARPPGVPYHFADWLADVRDAAAALGWKRFALMGHSLGAGIVACYAGTFPEQVTGLVLLDGLGVLTAPPADGPTRLAAHIKERSRRLGRQHSVYKDRSTAEEILREVAGHRDPQSTSLLVLRGTRAVDGGFVWRHDPRVRWGSPLRLTEEQLLAFLERIACPSVFVWAKEGYPWGDEIMQKRAATVKGLVVHQIEGGHHVHLDHPESVAPLVVELLERVAAS
jgi:pimeloyl-ACP methyl ester carboxylesterase